MDACFFELNRQTQAGKASPDDDDLVLLAHTTPKRLPTLVKASTACSKCALVCAAEI